MHTKLNDSPSGLQFGEGLIAVTKSLQDGI